MQVERIFGSDGEGSTPWPGSSTAAEPVLAACPIALSAFWVCPEEVQQFYRLAYEAALRAARPTRYERVSTVCLN